MSDPTPPAARRMPGLPTPGFLEELVRDAGALALRHFRRAALDVKRKADRSVVTEADHAVEAFLAARLRRAFPGAPIVGEENARDDLATTIDAADAPCFIIDPIDGTSLFASGMPGWCVSLGVFRGGVPWRGAVYLPVTDELYQVAEDGTARYSVGGGGAGGGSAAGAATAQEAAGLRRDAADTAARQDTGAGPAAAELRRAAATNGPAASSARGVALGVLTELEPGATLILTTHAHKNLRNEWPGRCLVMGAVAVDCCLVARGVAAAVVGRPNIWDVAASVAIAQAAGATACYLSGRPVEWPVLLRHPAARAPEAMAIAAPAYRERVLRSVFPRKTYEHPGLPGSVTAWLPGGEPTPTVPPPEAGSE